MERETDQEEWDRKNKAKVDENLERQERMKVELPEHIRQNMEQNKAEQESLS